MDRKAPITMTRADALKRAISAAVEAEYAMRKAIARPDASDRYYHESDNTVVKMRAEQTAAACQTAMAWVAIANALPEEPQDWEV